MDRRAFLKTSGVLGAGAAALGSMRGMLLGADGAKIALGDITKDGPKGAPNAEKLGWRPGCQAWTFNYYMPSADAKVEKLTFVESIDRTHDLGLHYIEAFPGQILSKEKPGEKMGPSLSAPARTELKSRLADNGLKLVNFGVVNPANKAVFDFAKDMGLETIVSEPKFDSFDDLDKLVEEYQINIAIHDHPKPSPYWNPDTVLKYVKDHNKRIGACCDTGHWMRSGVNPVEALKKLEGRIISFHLKDLTEFNSREAKDVPWGMGRGDIKGILTEVKRQGIKPVFSIEYETRFTMPQLAQCVAYMDQVAAELAKG
jgi:sugar phosphate isomerase/epimerase